MKKMLFKTAYCGQVSNLPCTDPRLYCLLLLLTVGWGALSAQNGITISDFSMSAGGNDAPTTLTFNIQWSPPQPEKVWSDTVWVFIDYNNAGAMTRLPLDPTAATLTWHSATYCPDCGVDRVRSTADGVWVVGNARASGSFSATVRAAVGAGFKPAPTAGACIYAINYPPVGRYTAANEIQFNGTPDFLLTLTDNSTVTVLRAAAGTYAIPEGKALKSFTDASKASGKCIPMLGNIDFSIPQYVVKGLPTTFTAVHPQAPASFAITYHWSASSFSPETHTCATFSPTAPAASGTFPVTLTATAAGHCDTSETKDVTVIDCILPSTYTLSASAVSVCEGSAATFTLSGSEGSAWSYQLYDGDTPVANTVQQGTQSSLTFTVTPAVGGHTYTVHTVNGNKERCEVLASSSVTVTVNPLPSSLTLTASPATICNGQATTLTASATDGGTYSYNSSSWQTATTFNVSPDKNASYTLTVQNQYGCSATKTNAAAVTVNALPAITLTTANNAQTVFADKALAEIKYTTANASSVTVEGLPDGVTGVWASGTCTVSGAPASGGIYYYTVTTANLNGCTDATATGTITVRSCTYTGSDLYTAGTHTCQQRAAGALNWEAWIQDTRDNELYRIVLMPDGKWWLAQNVKLASYDGKTVGAAISGCTKDECGRAYTWEEIYASYASGSSKSEGNVQGICPPGWTVPVRADYSTLANKIGNASEAMNALRCHNSKCSPRNDTYGWAGLASVKGDAYNDSVHFLYTNDTGREDGFAMDINDGLSYTCGSWTLYDTGDSNAKGIVRCWRQL